MLAVGKIDDLDNVKIDPDVEDDSINRGWLRLT
jgi:hypothetical protein